MTRHRPEDPRTRLAARAGRLVPWMICALGASLWSGLSLAETPGSKTDAAYVGRQACAECHTEQAKAWTGSHHDLAMQEATGKTVLGDFNDVTVTYHGVTSTFFKRRDGFFVRTDGPDGKLRDYRIAYTFGVDPLQQYLVALPGGRLQALGLAWDARSKSEGGQRWFHLYPDRPLRAGDPLHWTGRNQNWNSQCAECHSTNLRKNFDLEKDAFATVWSEIDVSCEACHGPGSAHVHQERAAGSASPRKDGRWLTVRLDVDGGGRWVHEDGAATARWKGSPRNRAEVETCAACHARRQAITKKWEPGRPFLDGYRLRLLDTGFYHADGQIDDEVYVYGSFIQSSMYAAGVTCSDCHDPHSLKLKASGNTLCGQCHQPETFDTLTHHHHPSGTASAQCVTCHMPAKTYMVVDPRRDHGFRVPRPDLSSKLDVPNACTSCHADRSVAWAATAIETWYGSDRRREPNFGTALHAGRRAVLGAGNALAAVIADPAQPAIARATALTLLPGDASPRSIDALRAGLADANPLVRTAALRPLSFFPPPQRLAAAGRLLDDPIRGVRIEAARTLAGIPWQQADPETRKAFDRAGRELVAAELASAERPESHLNLGVFYAEQRRFSEAMAAYRTAMRLEPSFVAAYVNLADLYRFQGNEGEAEAVLRRALDTVPDAASAHHALGLLLARQRRLEEAVESLARAAALRPENIRYGYVYGIALNSAGRGDLAVDVLESLQQHRPTDRDLLFALATINRDRGKRERAVHYAKLLFMAYPRDPTVRQLLNELQSAQMDGRGK